MKTKNKGAENRVWMSLLSAAVLICSGCTSSPDEKKETYAVLVSTETAPVQTVSADAPAEEEKAQSEMPSSVSESVTEGEVQREQTEQIKQINQINQINQMEESSAFYCIEIPDEIFAYMQGRSYKEDCTVPREDLRYLHILHKNAEGETLEGEMVVNAFIAEDVLEIMKELYEAGYPIESVRLVDDFEADDELSMEANNSSSFNFRFISHTTRVSKHGLGLAVDINTLYNPYVKTVDGQLYIEPVTAEPYTHREEDFPYKIESGDLCYRLFTEHGFEWGGDWTTRKDYQHFEVPDATVNSIYPQY